MDEPELFITKKKDAQYSLQSAQSFSIVEEFHCCYMQVKMQNSWIICKQLTPSCCLNSQRISLLFKDGCSNLTLPAELCCDNLYCCISQIFPNSEGSMYYRGHPFTHPKKLFWWQKSPNIFLLLLIHCGDVILGYLGLCICMKMEVTMNHGEAHCSNDIFNEIADSSCIMICPRHKIHQRNNIRDCLTYNTEHPAPPRSIRS